jgi:hypothetical protein
MRIGHVGNQHTWSYQTGRFFEKDGRRLFQLLDHDRTIRDVDNTAIVARVHGDRVDVFRIPYIVHVLPHGAAFLSSTLFKGEDGKLYHGNPQAARPRRRKAA